MKRFSLLFAILCLSFTVAPVVQAQIEGILHDSGTQTDVMIVGTGIPATVTSVMVNNIPLTAPMAMPDNMNPGQNMIIGGLPPAFVAGVYDVNIDGNVIPSVSFTVETGGGGANNPPSITTPTPGSTFNTPDMTNFFTTITAADPDGDPLSFNMISGMGSLTPNGATMADFNWMPAAADAGMDNFVTIEVNDGKGGIMSVSFNVHVDAAAQTNNPPSITTPTPGSTFNTPDMTNFFTTITAADPDGDALSFTLMGGMGSVTPNGPTMADFNWMPAAADAGMDNFVTIEVNDGKGGIMSVSFNVHVDAPAQTNNPPSITTPTPGSTFNTPDMTNFFTTITAADPDGDALSFTLMGGMGSVTPNGPTMADFNWMPAAADAGMDNFVTIEVNDGKGGIMSVSFTVHVDAPTQTNTPPMINNLAGQVFDIPELQNWSLPIEVFDAEGGPITITINTTSTAGAWMDGTNFTWNPPTGSGGQSFQVTLEPRDDQNAIGTSVTFTINVTGGAPANTPPNIDNPGEGMVVDVPMDQFFSYPLGVSDPEGNAVSVFVDNGPGGLMVTGMNLEWSVPTVGDHSVTLKADDGNGGESFRTFTLHVVTADPPPTTNTAPVVTSPMDGTVLNASENVEFVESIMATDAEGDALAFTLMSGPGVVTTTGPTMGEYRWMPTAADAGIEHQISVQIDDGHGGSIMLNFKVFVQGGTTPPPATNSPPDIVTPTETMVIDVPMDLPFTYPITVFDPDPGDIVTVSVLTGPAGLFASSTSLDWSVPTIGDHSVTLKAMDDKGGESFRNITLHVTTGTTPPPTSTITVTSLFIQPTTDNTGTEYKVGGTGFDASVTNFDIYYNGTYFQTFNTTNFTMTPTDLTAVVPVGFNTLASGDYYARVYLADNSFFDSPSFAVTGGTTPPTGGVMVSSLMMMPTSDNTGVEFTIFGAGLNATSITQIEIWQGAPGTGMFLNDFGGSMISFTGETDMKVIYAVAPSTLTAGDYYVKVSTTDGPMETPPFAWAGGGTTPPPTGGLQVWNGEFKPLDAGGTEVILRGIDIPALSVVTVGTHTLTSVVVAQDGDDPTGMMLQIEGMITASGADLPDGNYDVHIVTTDGGIYDFNIPMMTEHEGPTPGTGPQIWGGSIYTDTAGAIKIELHGQELPFDITSFMVGSHTVSGAVVTADPDDASGLMVKIEGTIAVDLSTFQAGPYNVDIPTSSVGPLNFPTVQIDVTTGPPPGPGTGFQLFSGEFKDEGDGTTKVVLRGVDIPALSIVMVGTHTLQNVTIEQDGDDPTGIMQQIDGMIAAPASGLPDGEYAIHIETTAGDVYDVTVFILTETEGFQLFGGHFAADETTAGQTKVEIHGKDFPADLTAVMVGTHGIMEMQLVPNPMDPDGTELMITGIIMADITGFSDGTYTVSGGSATAGAFTFDIPMSLEDGTGPTPGMGPQIWSGTIYTDDVGAIKITLYGTELPTDVTNVMVGDIVVSGAVVMQEPTDPTAADMKIEGVIAVDPATFMTGPYSVEVTSTTLGVLTFADVQISVGTEPGPGTDGPQVWGGHFIADSISGTVSITLKVSEMPTDLMTVMVGGFPLTGTMVMADPMDPMGQVITGILDNGGLAFVEGNYAVDITTTTGDVFNNPEVLISSEGTTPPPITDEPQVYNGYFKMDSTGIISITLIATNIPMDNTSVMVGGFPLTGVTVMADPNNPMVQVIIGMLESGGVPFVEGDYNVDIITSTGETLNFTDRTFNPEGTTPPPIGGWMVYLGMFYPDANGNAMVDIYGNGFPDVLTSVIVNGIPVTGITVGPDPEDPTDQVITGMIAVDLTTLVEGDFTVEISSDTETQTFPDQYFMVFTNSPDGPQIYGGDFYPTDAGQTQVALFGENIPLDLTSVMVGTYLVTNLQIETMAMDDTNGPLGKQAIQKKQTWLAKRSVTELQIITGIIDADISVFQDGMLPVTINWPGGDLSYNTVSFTVYDTPINFPAIYWAEIVEEAGIVSIKAQGTGFSVLTPADITSWRITQDDSTFSGVNPIYTVTGVTIMPFQADGMDHINGILDVTDITTMPKGNYWMEITATGMTTPMLVPFFFSPDGPPIFTYMTLEPAGSDTRVVVDGQNLGQIIPAEVYSYKLTQDDSSFAGVVYDVTNIDVIPDMNGNYQLIGYIAGVDTSAFVEGEMFAAISAQCLIDAGMPDPTIIPFYYVPGASGPPLADGQQVWSGEVFTDSLGAFRVQLWGQELPTDITTLLIGDDLVSGVMVMPVSGDPSGLQQKIEGVIAFDPATFATGPYTVEITSTMQGVLTFSDIQISQLSGPGVNEPTLYSGFFFEEMAGVTKVIIHGQLLPMDPVSGTVGEFNLRDISIGMARDDSMGMAQEVTGLIDVDFATLLDGIYHVDLAFASEPTLHEWTVPFTAMDGPPPIDGQGVWGGHFVVDSTGIISITLKATEMPTDLTMIMVGGFPLTGFMIMPDPMEPMEQVITGILNNGGLAFIEGTYAVDITLPDGNPLNFPEVMIYAEGMGPGTDGPQVWTGFFFMDSTGMTQVSLNAAQIPMDVTSIMVAGFPLTGFMIMPDPEMPESQVITGMLTAAGTALIEGNYTVDITPVTGTVLTFTDVWLASEGMSPGDGPKIWSGNFESDVAGMVSLELYGRGFPVDGMSITVMGFRMTNIMVMPDSEMPEDQRITGSVAADISMFFEGDFPVIVTLANGEMHDYPTVFLHPADDGSSGETPGGDIHLPPMTTEQPLTDDFSGAALSGVWMTEGNVSVMNDALVLQGVYVAGDGEGAVVEQVFYSQNQAVQDVTVEANVSFDMTSDGQYAGLNLETAEQAEISLYLGRVSGSLMAASEVESGFLGKAAADAATQEDEILTPIAESTSYDLKIDRTGGMITMQVNGVTVGSFTDMYGPMILADLSAGVEETIGGTSATPSFTASFDYIRFSNMVYVPFNPSDYMPDDGGGDPGTRMGPRLSTDSLIVIDDLVVAGSVYSDEIELTNTGDEELVIFDIFGEGGIHVEQGAMRIFPNETRYVHYNLSVPMEGPFFAKLMIFSNEMIDPTMPAEGRVIEITGTAVGFEASLPAFTASEPTSDEFDAAALSGIWQSISNGGTVGVGNGAVNVTSAYIGKDDEGSGTGIMQYFGSKGNLVSDVRVTTRINFSPTAPGHAVRLYILPLGGIESSSVPFMVYGMLESGQSVVIGGVDGVEEDEEPMVMFDGGTGIVMRIVRKGAVLRFLYGADANSMQVLHEIHNPLIEAIGPTIGVGIDVGNVEDFGATAATSPLQAAIQWVRFADITSQSTGLGDPAIAVTPQVRSFPPVPVGTGARRNVHIANPGTAPLSVQAVAPLDEPFIVPFLFMDAAMMQAQMLWVPPGEERAFEAFFQPIESGMFADTLVLRTNVDGADSLVYIPFNGETVAEAPILVDGPRIIQVTPNSATFEWETDRPSGSVVYYRERVFSGEQQTYTAVGDSTQQVPLHHVVVDSLQEGTVYQFFVKSSDEQGSFVSTKGWPGQVFKTLPKLEDAPPPRITFGPEIIDITEASMLVHLATDKISVVDIEYGQDTTLGSIVSSIDTSQSHILEVPALLSNTHYFYRVRVTDPIVPDKQTLSPLRAFRTQQGADDKPPVFLVHPFVDARTTNSISIFWATDEATNASVWFGPDTTAMDSSVVDTVFQKDHHILLSDLGADSVYYFYVRSADRREFETSTRQHPRKFRTLAQQDETPPVIILGPHSEGRTDEHVLIVWETNEPSDGFVEFGLDSNLTDFRGLAEFNRLHKLVLDGLTPNTDYFYRVATTDRQGNSFQTPIFPFRTKGAADMIPPFPVERPIVVGKTQDQASIRWVTNEPADGFIEYGIDSTYGQQAGSSELTREHLVTMTNLEADSVYHFIIKSTDGSDNTFTSLKHKFKTRAGADDKPPVIVVGPAIPFRTEEEAVAVWATDEIASGEVQYGPADAELTFIASSGSEPHRQHKVVFSDLLPGLEYRYLVTVTDPSGNFFITDTLSFTSETESDTLAPQLIAGPHAQTGLDQAEVEWVTDEVSDAIVEFGTSDTALTEQAINSDRVRVHKVRLSGLEQGAEYYFRFNSTDPSGNNYSSDIYEFRTENNRDDTPPKIIAGPVELWRSPDNVTLGWITSEPSETEVYYGLTKALGEQLEDATFKRDHKASLTNLLPDTTYYFVVEVEDVEENGALSDTLMFRTAKDADTDSPVILNRPRPKERTHNTAAIAWRTNELANSIVEFGTDTTLGKIREDAEPVNRHLILLTQLEVGTRYLFRTRSTDASGNERVTPIDSFRTRQDEIIDPPVIVKPPVVLARTENSATIGWATNRPSDSFVTYGVPDSVNREEGNTETTTLHRIVLTGLEAGTEYNAWVKSTDINRLTVSDSNRVLQFVTRLGRDTIPPVILTPPLVVDRGSDAARIDWVMDEPADAFIDYGFTEIELDFVTGTTDRRRRQTVFLTNLMTDTTYYFVVRSKDGEGNESSTAHAVQSFRTAAMADTNAPHIVRGPIMLDVSHQTATIAWETDEPADGSIQYGTSETDLSLSSEDLERTVRHRLVLTDLVPDTRYYYTVASTDLRENRFVTRRIRHFRTLAEPDDVPPVIVAGPIVHTTDRTAQAHWVTDEPANSFVYFKTSEMTQWEKIGDPDLTREHTVTVANLAKDVDYQFVVVSEDFSGNTITFPTEFQGTLFKTLALAKSAQPPGGNGSFRTSRNVDNTAPQIIEGPTILNKTASTATIQWTTDEQSDSFVEFGESSDLDDQKGDTEGTTTHEVTLTNLTPGQTYLYKVSSSDLNQNVIQSSEAVVTTDADEDVTPPEIVDALQISSITDEQVTILWETDEPSNSLVEYSLDTTFINVDTVSGLTRSLSEMEVIHKVTLTNLMADSTYYFRVQSTDINGNGPVTSLDTMFQTTAGPDTSDPAVTVAPTVWSISDNTARIGWGTDELSDSFVRYDTVATESLGKIVVGQRINETDLSNVTGSIDDVEEHQVTLTGLESGTTYIFVAGSQDPSGNENITVTDTFTTASSADITAPAAPTGLSANVGDGSTQLMWVANSENDFSSYKIYRSVAGAAVTPIATGVQDTFYLDDGLTNDQDVTYYVTAFDNVSPPNESVSSDTVLARPSATAAPASPVIVGAIAGVDQPVYPLLRVQNASNSDSTFTYDFWIAEDSEFLSTVVYQTGVAEGLTETGILSDVVLTSGNRYYWKARSVKGDFTGAWMIATSFEVDGTLAAYGTPAAPASLNAVDYPGDSGTAISLTFVASDNHPGTSGTSDDTDPVTELKVYRNTTSDFTGAMLWQRIAADSTQLTSGDTATVVVSTQGDAESAYYWLVAEAPGGRISSVAGPNRAQPINNNSSLAEDLSNNGEVDIWDVAVVAAIFGVAEEYDPAIDLSGNGEVDIWDVAEIAAVFGQSVSKPAGEPAQPGINAAAEIAMQHELQEHGQVRMSAIISQVSQLVGFQMTLRFDTEEYQFLGMEEGNFLDNTGGNALISHVDMEDGQIHVYGILLGTHPEELPSGEGALVSVIFQSLGTGAQDIQVENIKLLDGGGLMNVLGNANVESPAVPDDYALLPNYPNPFNPTTTVRFSMPEAGKVKLVVFNILGQRVKTLIDGELEAGFHQLMWNATNNNGLKVASGVYLYRIEAGSFVKTRKMLLLK
jgi:phosphodiesterase/alkaline phosphatase D-like protein